MSDTFIKETLTDATFQDGTTLSGSFTVEYDPSGALVEVTAADLIADLDGSKTEIRSLVPEATYTSTTGTTTTTHYELSNNGTLTGPVTGIDITFNSEEPTHLSVNDYNGLFTSIQDTNAEGETVPSALVTGGGGAIVDQVVCFFPGTTIATPTGEAAIETLIAGDLVTTTDGDSRPILWLGRQTVSTRFADPLSVLPIRIRAGALGDAVPTRDLLVSPCHAILVDGILIQAGALVNGISITREPNVPTVFTYYHIELADHSLILAEGVAAETFVDNVNRMGFDNWSEHEALGIDTSIPEMAFPRAQSVRQVPVATRTRLLARTVDQSATARAA